MTDAVYRERAHLVALLATLYPSTIGPHDPNWPEWSVVIIDLPTGQASWHVAPTDLDLFRHVTPSVKNTWDGHSTDEKYERIRRLIGSMLTVTTDRRNP